MRRGLLLLAIMGALVTSSPAAFAEENHSPVTVIGSGALSGYVDSSGQWHFKTKTPRWFKLWCYVVSQWMTHAPGRL